MLNACLPEFPEDPWETESENPWESDERILHQIFPGEYPEYLERVNCPVLLEALEVESNVFD